MHRDSPNEQIPNEPGSGLEARLQRAARSFSYPAAPDLAARERQRVSQMAGIDRRDGRIGPARSAQTGHRGRPAARRTGLGIALAVLAIALLAVMASPARARVVEWLRVGAVRLFLAETPVPTQNPLPTSLLGVEGETTLPEAAESAPFPLRLPGYPPDLGEPQRVYRQEINDSTVVISVWLNATAPDEAHLALYQIGGGKLDVFQKQYMRNVIETTVHGEWAIWSEGPYVLSVAGGQADERRLVTGRTLIWWEAGETYRLETDLPMEEARRIAESLEEWKK